MQMSFFDIRIFYEPVHVAITIGQTTVSEQEHYLMGGLWSQGDEVPEHVRVLQVGLGVSLLRVDERWEEDRVTDEEDRRVVADQVPDSIVSVKLDSETSGISSSISRTTFTAFNEIETLNKKSG